jgi:hypothetical protein
MLEKLGRPASDVTSNRKAPIIGPQCYQTIICAGPSGKECWCCNVGRSTCYTDKSVCDSNCHLDWITISSNIVTALCARIFTIKNNWMNKTIVCSSFLGSVPVYHYYRNSFHGAGRIAFLGAGIKPVRNKSF